MGKLQKQISRSSNPQSFTPLSLESSHIIGQLTSQLKYMEIENHLLKKDNFDATVLEKQIGVLKKENTLLKERLNYYVRLGNDPSSEDTLSLDLSEQSPSSKVLTSRCLNSDF